MIVDRLEHIGLCPLSVAHLRLTQAFLARCQAGNVPQGRYPLDGDRLFALVQAYDTRPQEEARMESHAKYADIQVILSGSETMRWAFSDETPIVQEEREARDIVFHQMGMERAGFRVDPGMFAFFAPWDAHMPCLQVSPGDAESVLKVVFKVLLKDSTGEEKA